MTAGARRWRLVLRLALADLAGEARLTACAMLSVAAVLAPLLVLAGLRAGVVEGMRETVLRDPQARQVVSVASSAFRLDLLREIAAWPEVEHLSPRTRHISASLLLQPPGSTRQARVQVIPSAPGDPLLPAEIAAEGGLAGPRALVLSATAAARLGLGPGGVVEGRMGRTVCDREERLALALTVQAVAAPGASDRDAAFVAPALAEEIEDWQEPLLDRGGGAAGGCALAQRPPRESYAGFRLYARRLEDVPALVEALGARGIETASRVGDIAPMLAVDRALGRLLLAVALVAGLGFVLSLGAGLWGNVLRKRRLLAGLRLMGCGRGAVLAVPVAQAALIALGGAAAGAGMALAAQAAINAGLGGLVLDRPLSAIGPAVLGGAAGLAVLAAVLASSLAAWQAAAIEPHEAVRGP